MDGAMEEDASMQEKAAMPDHSRAYEALKRPIDPSGSELFLPSYLRDMPYAEEVKYARERKAQKDKATERLALQNQRRKQNNSATANAERDTSVEQILGDDTSVPPLPSRWQPNPTDYLRNVRLEQNPFKLYSDAEGSARAEYCVPNLCGMYYYEVTVLDCPTESYVFQRSGSIANSAEPLFRWVSGPEMRTLASPQVMRQILGQYMRMTLSSTATTPARFGARD